MPGADAGLAGVRPRGGPAGAGVLGRADAELRRGVRPHAPRGRPPGADAGGAHGGRHAAAVTCGRRERACSSPPAAAVGHGVFHGGSTAVMAQRVLFSPAVESHKFEWPIISVVWNGPAMTQAVSIHSMVFFSLEVGFLWCNLHVFLHACGRLIPGPPTELRHVVQLHAWRFCGSLLSPVLTLGQQRIRALCKLAGCAEVWFGLVGGITDYSSQ